MEANEKSPGSSPPQDGEDNDTRNLELVNSSGHVQELDRTFSFLSASALAVVCDNAWGAGAGSLVVSLYNGGGPGVLYGFLAAVFFYIFISLALAELASALPSSANVYHWSCVTAGPKYGRIVSFYAGWWNMLAWLFGVSSSTLFASNTLVGMYSLYHPSYEPQRYQVFICFVVITWAELSLLLFGQRFLARGFTIAGVVMMSVFLAATLTIAIAPSRTDAGYASSDFVWRRFNNLTGWSSDGLVFVMGILNGAFAIGTPNCICHLCEETPNPKKNIPRGIMAQLAVGAVTTFVFYISLLYAITDLDAVFNAPIVALPLAGIFQQAMRSNGGTFGLLFLFLLDQLMNIPGGYVTVSRMLWTLARDDAVPFSKYIRRVDKKWRNPFIAQVVCGCGATVLCAIYVANATAFTAFVSCFAIFTTLGYLSAILPHLLNRRRNVPPGPYWMKPSVFYPVAGIACTYMIISDVIYMFPYVYPPTVTSMNYSCVMAGGSTILLTVWYLWKRTHGYEGPQVSLEGHDDVLRGIAGLTAEEADRMRKDGRRLQPSNLTKAPT